MGPSDVGPGTMVPALPYRWRASQGSRGARNGRRTTGNRGVPALDIEYQNRDSMKSKIRIKDPGISLLSN
jgi:hypothetical protein